MSYAVVTVEMKEQTHIPSHSSFHFPIAVYFYLILTKEERPICNTRYWHTSETVSKLASK